MYLSNRAAVVRNFVTAIVNGAITLTLLLIAPLGLAGVISNTFLVTVASFFVGTFSDVVIYWLSASPKQDRFSQSPERINITYQKLSSQMQEKKEKNK